MSTNTNTIDLDGKKYFCRQWSATKALEMNVRLITNMEALAFPFVEGTWTGKDIAGVMRDAPSDLMPMIIEFVCAARIDGRELQEFEFDMEYTGNLMRIFKVFSFVAATNFKDFFAQG